jgi:Fe-S-cluster containining protein
MSKIQEVVNKYNRICRYCDRFWKHTKDKYPTGIKCSAGCSPCCELQSVNLLEGFIIAEHLSRGSSSGISFSPPLRKEACPFLDDHRCRIYPARPLICRTHGLLLRSKDFTDRMSASCPFNFTSLDHAAVSDADALDVDSITNNLARLNAAFCMALGDVKKAKERIALRDLTDGKIGRSWFGV